MQPQTVNAPGGSYSYLGNNDYRGYLNYLASTGNAQARTLIGSNGSYGYANNSGQLTNSAFLNPTLVNANQQFYQQYQNYLHPSSLPGMSFGGGGVVAPPNWNINAIYNQAGSAAAGQVNPYYTSQLQQFQQNQAKAQALQEQQRQLSLQNLQDTLNNQLGQNEVSRTRTSQDVLQNEQQIGQQADYRQQDQGQQFNEARIAQAKQLAQGGLTGSGLGNQQVQQAVTARNVQEQRQGAQDAQDIAHQELIKARTFEDLANSDKLANLASERGQKQVQIDWNKFVQGQASDLQQYQQSLEQQRLQRLSEVQRQLAQQQLNNMIHNLSNPAQRLAAAQAYGSAF